MNAGPKPGARLCANVCEECGQAIAYFEGTWDMFYAVHQVVCLPVDASLASRLGSHNLTLLGAFAQRSLGGEVLGDASKKG